jgi:hypothetical protein
VLSKELTSRSHLSSSVWPLLLTLFARPVRFGNRYFENLNPEDEVPGQLDDALRARRPGSNDPLDPVQVATDGSTTLRYGDLFTGCDPTRLAQPIWPLFTA